MGNWTSFPIANTKAATSPFTITAGNTPISLSERFISYVVNVKDFGAVGDFVADDYDAVQRAVNFCMQRSGSGVVSGGVVFFPPGKYKFRDGASLTFPTTGTPITNGAMVRLQGTRADIPGSGSYIQGNVADWLINKPDNGYFNLCSVRDLNIVNVAHGGGCIQMNGIVTGDISDCTLQGYYGVKIDSNAYNVVLYRNVLTNVFSLRDDANAIGAVGVVMGQAAVEGCSFTGWDVGLQMFNATPHVHNCRFEVNNTGIVIGQQFPTAVGSTTGPTSQCDGGYINCVSFERDGTDIYFWSAASIEVSACDFTGTVGITDGSTCDYSIRVNAATNCRLSCCSIGGPRLHGNIVFDNAGSMTLDQVIVSPAMNLTTNAGTAAGGGSRTLHFADVNSTGGSGTGGIFVGQLVVNQTTPTSISNGTTVASFNSAAATITLSADVVGPGVGNGDTILFLTPNDPNFSTDVSGIEIIGGYYISVGTGSNPNYTPTPFPSRAKRSTYTNRPQSNSVVPPYTGMEWTFTDASVTTVGATVSAGGNSHVVKAIYNVAGAWIVTAVLS